MKGIYIFSTSDKDYRTSGEAKKVLSQYDAFIKKGVQMDLIDVSLSSKKYKLLYRLPFFGVYPRSVRKRINLDSVDFVYIRKNIFDSTYYRLLKHIKKRRQNIKIFVEIPTYPYFQEWNRWIDKPLILKEKRTLRKLKKRKYVDYYMSLTDDKTIFGTQVIKFENCVDLNKYSPKNSLQKPDEVHLLGVALLKNWHGFDRVIYGLKDYYEKPFDKKVVFHIVGNGPELKNLKNITAKSKLNDYVIFEGELHGEKLDHVYDICHIGVGPLGSHRKGLTVTNSLKLREYCAKGVPFIKAGYEYAFDGFRYCLDYPSDDSPIDIMKIVNFVNDIDYPVAIKTMREYASLKFGWDSFVDSVTSKI